MKRSLILILIFFIPQYSFGEQQSHSWSNLTRNPFFGDFAKSGCCSWHRGVCGCSRGTVRCCDGSLSPTCTCEKDDSEELFSAEVESCEPGEKVSQGYQY